MRPLLLAAALMLTAACDPVAPSTGGEWSVERAPRAAALDLHQVGWAWDYGAFLALSDDSYEFALDGTDGAWRERDDLLFYYACGPCKSPASAAVGDAWVHVWEGEVRRSNADGSTDVVWSGDRDARALWGDDDGLWIVGAEGLVVRWEGGVATEHDAGTDADFNAVQGGLDGSAWAVGDGGAVLAFDGETWAPEESGTDRDLFDVEVIDEADLDKTSFGWGELAPEALPLGDVVAVGAGGVVLRRTP